MFDIKKLAFWGAVILGGTHFIWAIFILIMPRAFQNIINRIFDIHMMESYRIITNFNFGKMLMLVVLTTIFGGIMGWIIGLIANNAIIKKNKKDTQR